MKGGNPEEGGREREEGGEALVSRAAPLTPQPMSRIRVAVLMGGRSAERDVSLSTGRQVLSALDPTRYDAFPVDPAGLHLPTLRAPDLPGNAGVLPASQEERSEPDLPGSAGVPPASPEPRNLPVATGFPLDFGQRPDVALICLHGRYGEDGTIQGMLELLGIPYTGSGVLASALAMDKVMTKRFLVSEGIPVPAGVVVRHRREIGPLAAAVRDGASPLTCPLIVKPNRQGSTIGVTIVRTPQGLAAAVETALEFDGEALVERFITGIEITAPILGNDDPICLPLVEIVPSSGFYDYEAKYTPGATDEIVPARLPEVVAAAAREFAVRAHVSLGCRGFSRTDMLVEGDQIWVLEVNTIPGMTPTSLLPRSAAAAGISFPELLDRMIALALEGNPHGSSVAVA